MKYTDEQIDAFLKSNNIELLSYQREMFKKLVNEDRLYLVIPPRTGRSFYDGLMKAIEAMEMIEELEE